MKSIDGPIRIGLMGAGSVADFGHLPAITATPGIEIHAIYDPIFERAVAAQKKFGAPHAFCDEELFFASGINAVSITSPAPTHKKNVLDCARLGFPVLCEKPIAMDDKDAREMIATMQSADLPFAVGFCYRFSPVAMEIKRLVATNVIGEVRSLRLIYIWNLHGIYEWDQNGRPFYSPARVARMDEGGPLVDCGVHQIDLARWWLGSEVESYSGVGGWVEDFEAPDHLYAHLRHASGALTSIEVAYTYCHTSKDPISHFSYHLMGTEGLIRYDREHGIFECRRKDGTDFLNWSHEKNFEGLYSEWHKTLTTGQLGHMPSGEDGLIATTIAREATNEAQRNRPEAIPLRNPVDL